MQGGNRYALIGLNQLLSNVCPLNGGDHDFASVARDWLEENKLKYR